MVPSWSVLAVIAIGVGVLLVAGIAMLLGSERRDKRLLQEIQALYVAGSHQEVLDHDLPTTLLRGWALIRKAVSANALGQFADALALLEQPSVIEICRARPEFTALENETRLVTLLGLGRYADAAALIDTCLTDPSFDSVRARCAIEVGDNDTADALLAAVRAVPLEEVARLMTLSDHALRGGDVVEGERLARDARRLIQELGKGHEDLVSECLMLEADARLKAGAPNEAMDLALSAAGTAGTHPNPVSRHARLHLLLAVIHAAMANRDAARRELDEAAMRVTPLQSPPLVVALTRARGLVALHLGDIGDSRHYCEQAIVGYELLGARPAADRLRQRLASLEG